MSVFNLYNRNCWVEISKENFALNLRAFRDYVGRDLLQVVKANAYGHGLEEIADLAEVAGVKYVGVATLGEAAALRDFGHSGKIFLMGTYDSNDVNYLIDHEIDFAVWTERQIASISEASKNKEKSPCVHLKIDTGMGRLGCDLNSSHHLIDILRSSTNLNFIGIWTHFSSADCLSEETTQDQIKRFDTVVAYAKSLSSEILIHAANSPGAMYFSNARYDMVRAGIISYGVPPDPNLDVPFDILPVLSWKARLASVRVFEKGIPISYGGEYVTQRSRERIGVIPVGYADGFRRNAENTVLINSREIPIVGRVCMDQCMVSLPEGVDFQVGDDVTIIGTNGKLRLCADDLARRWKTNSYDVLANISERVPRRFV